MKKKRKEEKKTATYGSRQENLKPPQSLPLIWQAFAWTEVPSLLMLVLGLFPLKRKEFARQLFPVVRNCSGCTLGQLGQSLANWHGTDRCMVLAAEGRR